jgi:hypothetical protein
VTSLLEKANDTNLLLVELEMPSVLRFFALECRVFFFFVVFLLILDHFELFDVEEVVEEEEEEREDFFFLPCLSSST